MTHIRKLKRVQPSQLSRNSKLERSGVTRPILFIEGVAHLFGCSVDHVRRIPTSELPRTHRVGKRSLFLLTHCVKYIEKKISDEELNDELTFMERSRQAEFLAEEIRNPAKAKK